jgi:hypothetical protein
MFSMFSPRLHYQFNVSMFSNCLAQWVKSLRGNIENIKKITKAAGETLKKISMFSMFPPRL